MRHGNKIMKKILIFIISYRASYRVKKVYYKIPFKKLKNYNVFTLISDDCSQDDTFTYAKKLKKRKKNIYINSNKINLGYGAHIKKCLNFAIKKKFNYAVMIHGDGQFDPKYISKMISILSRKDNIGAVTGSRMLRGISSVKKGGMPFYKMIGNILLTKLFNLLLNTNFTDTHTGLWAYNINYIKNKKFNFLTDSFNFDQQFRMHFINRNIKINEIPIKTKYGDERSQLHVKYAIKFLFNVIIFFIYKLGIINIKKYN